MKIIVGLGNPDKKYENTYHNIGFSCVNLVAEKLCANFTQEKFSGLVAETKVGSEKVIILKPLTYMNLSGESVIKAIQFYKCSLKDLIVVYDDFDLPIGEVRIRQNGSAGTHNGMRNIIKLLGSEDFARIRIGFNDPAKDRIPLIDLVLSKIKDEPLLQKAIERASFAGYDFANGKTIEQIMQKYNGKCE